MPKTNRKAQRVSKGRQKEEQSNSSCGTESGDDISYYSDTEIPNGLFVKMASATEQDYNPAVPEPSDDEEEDQQTIRKPEVNLHNNRTSANLDPKQTKVDDERRTSDGSGKFLQQILNPVKTLVKNNIEQEAKKKLSSSSQYLEKSSKKELLVNENNALTPAKYIPPKIDVELKLDEKPCQTFKLHLFQCVENATRRLLWSLGEQLSKIPVFLIIIPLLACSLAMVGVIIRRQNLDFRPPFDSYYSSEETASLTESREALFNDSNGRFDALQRISGLDFSVILKGSDTANILKEDFFDGYLRLKKRIEEIKVIGAGKIYKYSTLCRHSQDSCEMDVVQSILNSGSNIKFFYPEMDVPRPNKNSTLMFLGNTFGGVETDQDGAIAKAQSLAMYFKLKKVSTEGEDQQSIVRQWDDSFRNAVSKELEGSKQISYSTWSYGQFAKAVVDTFRSIYLYLGISLSIICVGCVTACLCIYGMDCTWTVMGFVGTLLVFCTIGSAVSADVGITGYLNAATFPTYFTTAASCTFALITILQSWKKYSNIVINPPEKFRFVLCWEGSCFVLICIILAIASAIVAVSTSTPLFRSVCQIMGFGYCLLLILVLFFFDGLLYVCGKREIHNSKCYQMDEKGAGLFTTPILKRFSLRDMELLHSKFLDKSPCISRRVGEFLASVHMRYITILLFCVYVIFAAWGCSLVPIQLNERHYLRLSTDLEMNNFLTDYDRYYSRYDNYIELIFGNPVDYYSQKTRTTLNDIFSWVDVEQHLSENVVSWLKDFVEFEKASIYLINRDTFVPVVDLIFLRDPKYKKYLNDVAMGKYNEQIVGSRMYVELNKIGLGRQLEIIKFIVARTKESGLPLSVRAPNIFLLQHDMELQTQMIISFTLMICVISFCTLIAFAQPMLTVITLITMVSTTVGTVGFSALWNVPLNAINEATVLTGIGYTAFLSITCCHTFNNAKFAGAKDRLIYTFQSVFYGCMLSGCVSVAAFVPLLIVDCDLIGHQAKIIFFHCIFSILHCFIFLPPLLILCSTSAPVFCRALKEMCNESCCCCDTEEDATSIYYLPTSGWNPDPMYVQQFFRMKFREDINTPQPQLPAPPRREMILPPPSAGKPNGDIRKGYPPDLAMGPGHYHGQKKSYPNSRNVSRRNSFREEECLRDHEAARESRDHRGGSRSRRRRSASGNRRKECEREDKKRKSGRRNASQSPSAKDHRRERTGNNDDGYSEPSDPENVQEPGRRKRRSSQRRTVSENSSSVNASCTIDDSHADDSETVDDITEIDDKPKSKICYAKWTKEIPVNAYTTERVTAEKYTIEGDGNRLELPPDWKRFWLNGDLRQAQNGGKCMEPPPRIGMTPTADHHIPMHPRMQMPPSHYPYHQAPHGPPGPEMYGPERPRVYNGSRGGHSQPQYPQRPPVQPPNNYRKPPTHW